MSATLRIVLSISLVILTLLTPLRAQTPKPVNPKPTAPAANPAPAKPAEPDTDAEMDDDEDSVGTKTQNGAAAKPKAPAVEPRIYAKEEEELFKSVDEILKFASQDMNLPIKESVKRELATREHVQSYVEEKLAEDEDQKRFERTELVLKKFGLLPREFELRPFMLSLLREQVAGFYDSKRKIVHLLDWLPLESQQPVMAHELTHALQDQKIDLEKWMKVVHDSAKNSPDPDNAEIESDEIVSARSALVEGQGMAVLIDFILAPSGRSLADSPQIVEAMKQAMDAGQGSTILDSAPLLLRESLTFPYRDGLSFVQALLKDGGKDRAFAEALSNPPQSTHEILTPKDYLQKKPPPTMHMPNVKEALGKKYEHYDVGSIGQFDVAIILKQFADDRTARDLSPEWRGGMYYSGFKKTARKTAATLTGDLAVLYVSRWSSPAAAEKFADAYGTSVRKRYSDALRKYCDH